VRKEISMYTVKELIEALQHCPEDYKVFIDICGEIEYVGIDDEEKTVNLFE
jgi:predicted secreted protein